MNPSTHRLVRASRAHRPLRLAAGFAAIALSAGLLAPSAAHACGGCFAPPGAVQSVTDHRMVLSISARQTILWDQFSYAGNPSDFSWILPIQGGPEVRVDLADNRFMQVLDNLTAPTLYQPRRPSQNCGGNFSEEGDFANAGTAPAPSAGGVTVHREEVVGPYAVAIIGGTDAMAVRVWLRDNGFSVPAAIEPVIDHYVALRSDFVALRLRAGTSVNRMSPVRITMPGYAPTLPLRMVAAGVSDKVAMNLLILADSRFEATNFPNGEVRNTDLIWDWNSAPAQIPAEDFRAAERAINVRNAGRAWITEAALAQSNSTLTRLARNAVNSIQGPTTPVCPADGSMTRCVEPTPEADMAAALAGLTSNPTITRMRADLAGQLLDRDLQLAPAAVPSERPREYSYGVVRNAPPAPPPCAVPSPARPGVTPIRCSAVPAGSAGFGLSGAAFALSALAAAARRRAKR
ncbi:MAG: DUF2330 domain-containing protein [Deltaproteobacteria bacterium]|nr:DUF2330 domain-containing protein [Deltaproteobacteria bacterium]